MEVLPAEDQQAGVVHGNHVGRAGLFVDDCHLAEKASLSQHRQDDFAAILRDEDHLDLPGRDKKDDATGTTTDEPPPSEETEKDGGPVDEALVKKRSLAALREWVDHSRQRLDEWQKQVETKIQTTIDGVRDAVTPWSSINKDVKTLADRIEELEAKLRELETTEEKH